MYFWLTAFNHVWILDMSDLDDLSMAVSVPSFPSVSLQRVCFWLTNAQLGASSDGAAQALQTHWKHYNKKQKNPSEFIKNPFSLIIRPLKLEYLKWSAKCVWWLLMRERSADAMKTPESETAVCLRPPSSSSSSSSHMLWPHGWRFHCPSSNSVSLTFTVFVIKLIDSKFIHY